MDPRRVPDGRMANRDIVVIGASAGGVEALMRLVSALPADFPAAVFVTLHVPPGAPSALPGILSRKGPLPAVNPRDGETIEPGHIYVAPSDRHMLVKHGCIRFSRGPRENSARPAVDPMFRTAARAYGPRVVAVVLTGTLDDGTAGMMVVKGLGGTAVVQDPEDAPFPGMPTSVLQHVAVDHVLPLDEIPDLLVRLTRETISPTGDSPAAEIPDITEVAMTGTSGQLPDPQDGIRAGLSCPDCGGTLWEREERGFVHYRCRVGHSFGEASLQAEQVSALEAALWVALRALEENAALSRGMSERMAGRGSPALARRFAEQATDMHRKADMIRDDLLEDVALPVDLGAARADLSSAHRDLSAGHRA